MGFEVHGKRPDTQYDKPAPTDGLDEGADHEPAVDGIVDQWQEGRNVDRPAGPAGEFTNMEVLQQDTYADHEETDPTGSTAEDEQ